MRHLDSVAADGARSMSLPPNRVQVIEFLVNRKFGFRGKSADGMRVELSAERLGRTDPAGASAVPQYKRELHGLTEEALQAIYDQELERYVEDIRRRETEEERGRLFSQPHADADFDHWSKAEHWTLDEAIALSFGKAPEAVNWKRIESFIQISHFAKQYQRRRDLAQRAAAWKKLYDPVLPLLFLKWAKDNEIDVPAGLVEKVEARKGSLVDWKKEFEQQKAAYEELNALYDKFRSQYDKHVADWKKLVGQRSEQLAAAMSRIADLEAELALIKNTPPAAEPAKPQSMIERQNMLKAIYGMAVKGYSYKPDDKRSTVVTEIVGDLALVGLPISDDTIRRYLKEARENLGEWQEMSG
jgi:hypothetical protein